VIDVTAGGADTRSTAAAAIDRAPALANDRAWAEKLIVEREAGVERSTADSRDAVGPVGR
jgi:hypothetical protein